MNYYKENTQEFIKNTLEVDMSELHSKFLEYLKVDASILDVGSGAGRDLKSFKEVGYRAIGIEPCIELAQFSTNYSGCRVEETTIENYITDTKFDGIWACASLLHLNDHQLKIALSKIKSLCHARSIVYCSFKHGDFQGERSGRYFNDKTIKSLSPLLSGFKIEKHWITSDKRIDRDESWLNVILSTSEN
jgi:SAM-dependent methyltransferase